MRAGGWLYLASFSACLLIALLLTPLMLRVARRLDILDRPGSYKQQELPVPYLGGTAIVVAFSTVVAGAALVGGVRPSGERDVLIVLGLAVALSLIGLIDDVRGVHVAVRFGAEVAAAIALFVAGIRIELFQQELFNVLLTIIWIVGITNAFNLLDNMDGLSGGIAAISATSFFAVAALNGQFLVAALSAALAGCALGFLRHNFHPAKIYMGDAGSLFFGFVLAVIGLRLRFDAPQEITFMVPILILGIPIFDTSLVTVSRIANKLNPLSGARDHTSHRLVFIGIPVRAAVALIYGSQVALAWLALIMSRLDATNGYLLMVFVLATGLFFGLLLGRVPVHANSKRRHLMIREVKPHEPEAAAVEGDGYPPAALPS